MHRKMMLRITSSRRVLWVCMATILGLLILWSGQAMAAEPKRGGTLRVAYGNKLTHLDFHTAAGYEMMWVAISAGRAWHRHGRIHDGGSRCPSHGASPGWLAD